MLTIGHHINEPTVERIIDNVQDANNIINNSDHETKVKNAIQLFNIGPRSYKCNNIDRKGIKELCVKNNIEQYSHASYYINLSKIDNVTSNILHNIKKELQCAYLSGAHGVVMHVAKCTIQELKDTIKYIDDHIDISMYSATIVLEAKASKPYCALSDIDGILEIDNFITTSNFTHRWGICVDTAHLWAYGHDLHDTDTLHNILNKLASCAALCLFHFNDSYNGLGSGSDKHADLTVGFFTHDLVQIVFDWCIKNDITIIFESHTNPLDNYKLLKLN